MMSTFEWLIKGLSEDDRTSLISRLEPLDEFTGGMEYEGESCLYFSHRPDHEQLKKYLSGLDFESDQLRRIQERNWNEKWESEYTPIEIGDSIRVHASFHEPDERFKYNIQINPQMSFGTGHHATTYLVLEKLLSLNLSSKKVFDYGCGTGILAIAAKMMGAKKVFALDNSNRCVENTIDNAKINKISIDQAWTGELQESDYELLRHGPFDIVLANINRNVILENLNKLSHVIKEDGIIIVSGILDVDKSLIIDSAEKSNLRTTSISEKEDWVCIQFEN